MALPQRPLSGSIPYPGHRGSGAVQTVPAAEIVKARVLFKLQDRLDLAKLRRMPASLMQQTARQQVEQTIDADAARLPRADRDRLVEEVLAEAVGFGPLEGLLRDPATKEVMLLGPQSVIVRREQGWGPTNVKLRDEEHVQELRDRAAALGEVVGGALSGSALDVKLPNGFRVVAVTPPPVMNMPPTVVFTRAEPASGQHHTVPAEPRSGITPAPVASNGPASGRYPASAAAAETPPPGENHLARYRVKITARITAKLASLGVYDLTRVDVGELRKVVAAYVQEYCESEHIYLSDTDQGRLILEILTGMNR